MTSPAQITAADAKASPTVTSRSRKRWHLLGILTVIVAMAFATSACEPAMTPKEAVAKYWGKLSPCAEKIVKRESNFQADAVNRSSGATGLFQLMPSHAKWIKQKFGYEFSEMKDPAKNAQVAKALSNEAYNYWGDGWQPWRLSSKAVRGGGCPA